MAVLVGFCLTVGGSGSVVAALAWHVAHGEHMPASPAPLSPAQRIHQALVQAGFVGSVLVAQHGKVILAHGYGRSGLRAPAPPDTARTIYNADGLTVPLTVSALLQLHEEGKLSVADSICRYLSGCPSDWKPLTVENLLDCTARIYDPIIDDSAFHPTPRTTTAEYLARAAAHPLVGIPGHPDRGPCDPEPIIAGSILQIVSGQSFPSYIERQVIQPARLRHSGVLRPHVRIPGMATPYGAGHTAPPGWINGAWSYGLTGLYSTVRDVYRWDEAWLGDKIVSPHSLQSMETGHGQGSPYGWELYTSPRGNDLLVASGESPWTTAVNAIVPSTDTIVIFLSNTATNAPSYVTPILSLLRT